MPSLSEAIAALAEAFATDVLTLTWQSSVNEINADPRDEKRSPGRRPSTDGVQTSDTPPLDVKRMSADTIDSVATLIVRYVKSHQGAKAETIRKQLGIPREKWMRPLAFALGKKGLSKKGEKRATTYWVK
jgi:hypothetical protein